MQTLTDFFGKYSIDPANDTIDFSGKSRMLDRVSGFIQDTVNYFETENYLFVHGWIPGKSENMALFSDEEWEKARWVKWTDKYTGEKPLDAKTVVCGHMPTFYAKKFDRTRSDNDGGIFWGNGIIAIDAGTHDTGQVNVLVLEDNLI